MITRPQVPTLPLRIFPASRAAASAVAAIALGDLRETRTHLLVDQAVAGHAGIPARQVGRRLRRRAEGVEGHHAAGEEREKELAGSLDLHLWRGLRPAWSHAAPAGQSSCIHDKTIQE